MERLYDIPNPEDQNCYDKLITQIRIVFARHQNERLELLLKNLTLSDRFPNELMRHLIVAAGTDSICSPQFEEILNDKFLKALPSDIAANSGNWNYTDLRTLANCATQAINANKRMVKVTILFWLLLKNNYPLLTNIRIRMARRKHFRKFEEILFAVEVDCVIFVEHLIACQELLLLGPRHFNVIDVVMVTEDFGITINIINPDNNWFRKMITFAITTDVSMKTLIIVKALVANFLSNLVAVLL